LDQTSQRKSSCSLTEMETTVSTPETEESVCLQTGMQSRLMNPDPEWNFLRCQLGTWGIGFKGDPVFALSAYGSTWANAYTMFDNAARARAIILLS
jgi:hypothetical protein